jgi:plasmid stabilization system protein ParE
MGEFERRLTSQAARDLREIVAYIARDNPVAAERFGFALVEKAELLKKFPLLGRKVEGEKDRVLEGPHSDFLSTGQRRRCDRD